jgi:hypothetical protein
MNKLNKRIEAAIIEIQALEKAYTKKIIYAATRRYNNRIYIFNKKCQKKRK